MQKLKGQALGALKGVGDNIVANVQKKIEQKQAEKKAYDDAYAEARKKALVEKAKRDAKAKVLVEGKPAALLPAHFGEWGHGLVKPQEPAKEAAKVDATGGIESGAKG